MRRIYLDNAATSFPKAPGIGDVIKTFLERDCTNINRTSGAGEFPVFDRLFGLRSDLAKMLGFSSPECVCLSSGVTESLNLVISGLLTKDDHVLVSSCEHNSVMRPLVQRGIPFSRIPCDNEGYIILDRARDLIRPNTKAMIICAAGNVTGAIQDVGKIARFAYDNNLLLIFDAAQAIPYVDFNMEENHVAAVVFSGHKGLLGPQGIGALLLDAAFAERLRPLVTGGTGSASDSELQPGYMPDRFESGTLNLPGIFGLHAALDYLLKTGVRTLGQREQALTGLFLNELNTLPVHIAGPASCEEQVGVVSLDFTDNGLDNGEIAYLLERDFGIMTRVGLHCAPNAHRTLGTFPQGSVRFSFGFQTTEEDLFTALRAIRTLLDSAPHTLD